MPLKRFFIVLLVVLLSLGCIEKPSQDIVIVTQDFPSDYVVLWAIHKGVVELEGVTIKTLSYAKKNEMLITGEAQIGYMPTNAFAVAYNKVNRNLKITSTFVISAISNGIYTYEGSGIEAAEDLKGKTIAMPQMTSTNTIIALGILKHKYGINASDIKIISKPPSMIPILVERKEVDAGMIMASYTLEARSKKLKLVVDTDEEFRELYGSYPVVSLLVAQKDMDRERVAKILDALRASREIGIDNIDEVSQEYYKTFGKNESAWLHYVKERGTSKYLEPLNAENKQAIQQIWVLSKEFGVIDEVPDIDEVTY